jgi:predicted transglutaminase-like cysteine proteinase
MPEDDWQPVSVLVGFRSAKMYWITRLLSFAMKAMVLAQRPRRRAELEDVNSTVNRTIAPEEQPKDAVNEQWIINPIAGDCNDYAVTKHHNLITKGWPEDALQLTEIGLPTGEHHLVLRARLDPAPTLRIVESFVHEVVNTMRQVSQAWLSTAATIATFCLQSFPVRDASQPGESNG